MPLILDIGSPIEFKVGDGGFERWLATDLHFFCEIPWKFW